MIKTIMEIFKNDYVTIQEEEQGIVKLIYNNIEPTLELAKEYSNAWITYLNDLDKKVFPIYDLRSSVSYINADVRIYKGNFLEANKRVIEEKVGSAAFVINSTMLEMALKAIFMICPSPVKVELTKTMEEAKEWLANNGLNGGKLMSVA